MNNKEKLNVSPPYKNKKQKNTLGLMGFYCTILPGVKRRINVNNPQIIQQIRKKRDTAKFIL